MATSKHSAAAPGGAPGGAPGSAPAAAPAAAPAGPADKWGADSHGDEFGNEYAYHERKNLREPHIGNATWQSEMYANAGDFDPHGRDFVTDSRSPAKMVLYSGAASAKIFAAGLAAVAGFVAM